MFILTLMLYCISKSCKRSPNWRLNKKFSRQGEKVSRIGDHIGRNFKPWKVLNFPFSWGCLKSSCVPWQIPMVTPRLISGASLWPMNKVQWIAPGNIHTHLMVFFCLNPAIPLEISAMVHTFAFENSFPLGISNDPPLGGKYGYSPERGGWVGISLEPLNELITWAMTYRYINFTLSLPTDKQLKIYFIVSCKYYYSLYPLGEIPFW